jgi:outer membrane protein assembly factor BamE (lipoprotein component of BamABCDE complex)
MRLNVRMLCGAALVAVALAGCDDQSFTRGYVPDQQALAQIKPGSSAEQVILVMGTPSTVSTVGGKTYYYISQQVSRRFQFMPEKISDQRVLAISIDGKNKVEKIANYGIEDGKVFDFISRTTPTGGAELSLLRQLLKGPGGA